MTNSINRFYTLNKMQRDTNRLDADTKVLTHAAWQVRAIFGKRLRIVSYIFKTPEGYQVSVTGLYYKNFMKALASLVDFYISEIWKLIRSESSLKHSHSDVSESTCMFLSNAAAWDLKVVTNEGEVIDLSKPYAPTYDRGPKKEVRSPLRRAATAFFGGVYGR